MLALLIVICAYLVGSISFAVVVSRAFGLPDPHEYGSGNPGATNVLRTGNRTAALLTLLGDGLKGFITVFAAQAIAVNRQMGWDTKKVNVNGGAIALGHPIGASGCRILVTLLHEMQKRDAKKGLASLCIGGGMGVALAVER